MSPLFYNLHHSIELFCRGIEHPRSIIEQTLTVGCREKNIGMNQSGSTNIVHGGGIRVVGGEGKVLKRRRIGHLTLDYEFSSWKVLFRGPA